MAAYYNLNRVLAIQLFEPKRGRGSIPSVLEDRSLGVGPVSIASLLDKQFVAVRLEETRYEDPDIMRWASPLGQEYAPTVTAFVGHEVRQRRRDSLLQSSSSLIRSKRRRLIRLLVLQASKTSSVGSLIL